MPALPSNGPDPRPKPPASDPELEGKAFEWDDRFLPGRPLRFIAKGTVQSCSWATLAERTVAAFAACNLDLAEIRHPPFSRSDLGFLGAQRGVGYIVAEADLQRARVGFLQLAGYKSFIAALSAWVNPALGKHDVDSELVPHDWILEVRAGRVFSEDHEGRGVGQARQFSAIADSEDAFAWIAGATLTSIGASVQL